MRVRRLLVAATVAGLALSTSIPAGAQSPEDALEVALDALGQAGGLFRNLPGGLDRGLTGPLDGVFEDLAGANGCDPSDPMRCLLPFPNDRFTVGAGTPTGRRVNLNLFATPRNILGKPLDPTEWNRNDGFSPGSMGLTYVPRLDLAATFGLPDGVEAQLQMPELSLADDAPIVLLNATTGERHPYFAELDSHPDTRDHERLLIIRPLRNLEHGHRYVIGLRNLRDADGNVLPARSFFAARRDGDPRRYEQMLTDLQDSGVDTSELYLAWDFTVISQENLTGRALAMRDQTFRSLGDPDLTDGVVAGRPPSFSISSVEQRNDDLAIRGSITAPSYLLLPQDLPRIPPAEFGLGVEQALPGSRLWYGDLAPGAMARPKVNPVTPTQEVEFVCHLPNQATASDPARPTLYGHGLLGSIGETGGGSTSMLRADNFAVCSVPWIGMATEDVLNVATILADVSNFPTLPDRAQQGFLNFHLLGRLLVHEDGFASHAAFQDDDGNPRIDTSELFYDGNSQGGIMGGALTALAPDFTKAVLGVPGGNYSTLLNRSVDWEGAYGDVLYAFYPDKADQQLLFALIQMLWDRAETNGYAHVMTDDPLPNTPAHQVILQVAYADHQVANVAAEVDARTAGAHLLQTSLAAGRHWADITGQRTFGLGTFGTVNGIPQPHDGSALVYVDSGNRMPPHGNVPPRDGGDPHGDPRSDVFAHAQRVAFFETGLVYDTRAGQPYWSRHCRGPHNPEACGSSFQPW